MGYVSYYLFAVPNNDLRVIKANKLPLSHGHHINQRNAYVRDTCIDQDQGWTKDLRGIRHFGKFSHICNDYAIYYHQSFANEVKTDARQPAVLLSNSELLVLKSTP